MERSELAQITPRARSRRSRGLRTLILSVAALGVLAFAQSASAATAPSGFFGVGGWTIPSTTQAASLSSAGLGLVRAAVGWGQMQPTSSPSSINWSYTDQLAEEAASDNFNLILDLNGCAVWACGSVQAPPTGSELTAYEAFITAMVARYEPSSSFWAGQTHIPTITWQVWNEVNNGVSWPNPTPAAYAAFLSAIATTIRSVDPGASVLMSGLDNLPTVASGMTLQTFLAGLFQQPGFTQSTEAIAVNAYAPSASASVNVLDGAHAVAIEAGNPSMPTWVTEMGWASGGPPSAFTVSPAQQNQYLQQSWDTMLACAPRWDLQHVLWFSLQDQSAAAMGAADYWGYNNGLLNVNGSPKASYSSFLQFIGAQPLPSAAAEECTLPGGYSIDTTDPHTTILKAPGDTNNTKSQIVTFAATENGQAVAGMQYQCSLDSSAWTPCSSPFNAANSRGGDHTLIVRGIDPQGNIDPSPASVTWLLDLTKPDTVITWHARHVNRANRMKLRFKGMDPGPMGHFQCRIDKRRWRTCASPYTTPHLAHGHHTVLVRAIDLAGNVDPTPAYIRFTVPKR
jgi:hypothetical protein